MEYKKKISEVPSLTIGIPTLNEGKYIESILRTFLDTEYPNLKEILVCDGGSSDQTRKIVDKYTQLNPIVRLVDNPQQKQVYAFNKMIDIAQGELLMIIGAHSEYDKNYIEKCIELHKKTEALNVGGPTRLKADSVIQYAIVMAWYSVLGNGGAKHRNPNYTGYTDTLFPGCYVIQALRDVGGFNVDNVTNQDSEINLRISQLKDKAHYIDKDILVYYYPRATFSSLAKQYFRYGRGRFLTSINHFPKIPLRGYVSFLFLWINIGFVIAFSNSGFALASFYGLLLIILTTDFVFFTSKELKEENVWTNTKKKRPSNIVTFLFSSFSLTLMHLFMGMGFSYQLIKSIFNWKMKW